MAKRGKAVNRRKPAPGGGRTPLLALLIVALLIAAAFFLLEHFKKPSPPSQPPAKPAVSASKHQPMPERTPPVQQKLSTSRAPAVKPHPAALPKATGPGRLAIIIDDMGTSMQELKTLQSIGQPLTYSVIPSLAHAKQVAEGAHAAGAEVMVHMPMEPEGYPKQKLESVGVLVAMDDGEIANRIRSYFATVPHAVGANNHMGSRFTQDAAKMKVVLQVLKEKGVFFVDSKTSPASVGYREAKALGMKCAVRQVFLDNVQDEGAIGKQLAQAAATARKKGAAIAICHPHPATMRALKVYMPELAKSGITFVHASELTN
ncbi:divergent polysaccharide deacetylase family protein [Geomonas subterranea]|uniref:Divergent polysaccharide deacetylase family protein n=1 Tax=Geomonas subterranea TaxID=2847989 RepID=A0ABX8LJV9_9BACT|nr:MULTISPECIES: divergent polysaccharide deacetylase family protein [Geomonas]QXE91092.1 divergent polysaccharide deacetylase family protein [Geomonas subterranea]QXM10820.1 divergent polysaccharide deacetylase family protein [Geomonas subterranea]